MALWSPEAFGAFVVASMFVVLVVGALIDVYVERVERKRAIARRLRSIR